MTHPVDAVYVNGSAVSKAAIRTLIRSLPYDFVTAANLRTYDLDNTSDVLISGVLFRYDSADFTTADDGTTCIVDLGGRRFKKVTVSISGNVFYRQTGISGTANAPSITTDGMSALSATPQFVFFTPSLNSLAGAYNLTVAGSTVAVNGADGSALSAADNVIAGRTYLLSVTSTAATILMSGATW